jgi:hypothetical protein
MKRYSILLLIVFSILAALSLTSCVTPDSEYRNRQPRNYNATVYQGSTWGYYPRGGYYHYGKPNREQGHYRW